MGRRMCIKVFIEDSNNEEVNITTLSTEEGKMKSVTITSRFVQSRLEEIQQERNNEITSKPTDLAVPQSQTISEIDSDLTIENQPNTNLTGNAEGNDETSTFYQDQVNNLDKKIVKFEHFHRDDEKDSSGTVEITHPTDKEIVPTTEMYHNFLNDTNVQVIGAPDLRKGIMELRDLKGTSRESSASSPIDAIKNINYNVDDFLHEVNEKTFNDVKYIKDSLSDMWLNDLTDTEIECFSNDEESVGFHDGTLQEYYVIDGVIGSRFNSKTKKQEFLLKSERCTAKNEMWNPVVDPEKHILPLHDYGCLYISVPSLMKNLEAYGKGVLEDKFLSDINVERDNSLLESTNPKEDDELVLDGGKEGTLSVSNNDVSGLEVEMPDISANFKELVLPEPVGVPNIVDEIVENSISVQKKKTVNDGGNGKLIAAVGSGMNKGNSEQLREKKMTANDTGGNMATRGQLLDGRKMRGRRVSPKTAVSKKLDCKKPHRIMWKRIICGSRRDCVKTNKSDEPTVKVVFEQPLKPKEMSNSGEMIIKIDSDKQQESKRPCSPGEVIANAQLLKPEEITVESRRVKAAGTNSQELVKITEFEQLQESASGKVVMGTTAELKPKTGPVVLDLLRKSKKRKIKGNECDEYGKVIITDTIEQPQGSTRRSKISELREVKPKTALTSGQLEISVKEVDNRRSGSIYLTCPFCKYRTSRESIFQNHIRRHHASEKLKCEICADLFNSNSALRQHKKTHSSPKKKDTSRIPKSIKVKLNKEMLIEKLGEMFFDLLPPSRLSNKESPPKTCNEKLPLVKPADMHSAKETCVNVNDSNKEPSSEFPTYHLISVSSEIISEVSTQQKQPLVQQNSIVNLDVVDPAGISKSKSVSKEQRESSPSNKSGKISKKRNPKVPAESFEVVMSADPSKTESFSEKQKGSVSVISSETDGQRKSIVLPANLGVMEFTDLSKKEQVLEQLQKGSSSNESSETNDQWNSTVLPQCLEVIESADISETGPVCEEQQKSSVAAVSMGTDGQLKSLVLPADLDVESADSFKKESDSKEQPKSSSSVRCSKTGKKRKLTVLPESSEFVKSADPFKAESTSKEQQKNLASAMSIENVRQQKPLVVSANLDSKSADPLKKESDSKKQRKSSSSARCSKNGGQRKPTSVLAREKSPTNLQSQNKLVATAVRTVSAVGTRDTKVSREKQQVRKRVRFSHSKSPERFSTEVGLATKNQNKKNQSRKKVIKCPVCALSFKKQCHLTSHQKRHSGVESLSTTSWSRITVSDGGSSCGKSEVYGLANKYPIIILQRVC